MKLNGKAEIIQFLFRVTIEECRSLKEILSECENTFITIDDLLDMEKCVEYFMNLGKLENLKNKKDDEIIKLFKETLSKYEYVKTLIYFANFVEKYSQIKLFQATIDKVTYLKNIIYNIINSSTFIISNSKENSFQCNYDDRIEMPSENKENIIAFRDRAQLSNIKNLNLSSLLRIYQKYLIFRML